MNQLGRLLGLGALLGFRPAAAARLVYEDSLPDDLPSACSEALLADVACSLLVRDLHPDFLLPPEDLEDICTPGCATALASWKATVQSACPSDLTIPWEFDLPASPVVIPDSLQWLFEFTCLRVNSNFCGPVAALAIVFADPGGRDCLNLDFFGACLRLSQSHPSTTFPKSLAEPRSLAAAMSAS